MKRTLLIISLTSLVLLLLGALSFGSCGRPDGDKSKGGGCSSDTTAVDSVSNSPIDSESTTYNIFIENSGSMKGFFSGNSSSELETIIRQYYDRLTESDFDNDTVTLNYINDRKEKSNQDIEGYLKTVKSKCTASYTEIDNILKMSMDNAKKNNVNIVISDYCFESPNGNLQTAQSGITKLFTQQLKANSKLSVVILKYEVNFNGKYFPGGIDCNQKLPVYLWVFGDASKVKKILSLPVKEKPLHTLLLQKSQELNFTINASNLRAIDGNEIVVKNLDKDKRTGLYSFDIITNLTQSILSESALNNIANYTVTSSSASSYRIEKIVNDDDQYTFTISTDRPAPGNLIITYNFKEPEWIEESNFEGSGIPPKGKTHGIMYLIGGVFDAFNNLDDNYFTISIKLR